MESVGAVCGSDKRSSSLLTFWHRHSHCRTGNLREGKIFLFVAVCLLCFLFLSFILRLSLYTVKPNASPVAPWAFENPKQGIAELSPSQWFPHGALPCLYTCMSVCAAVHEEQFLSSLKGSHCFAFCWVSLQLDLCALVHFRAGGWQKWLFKSLLTSVILSCSGDIHVVIILQLSRDIIMLIYSETEYKIYHVLSCFVTWHFNLEIQMSYFKYF